MADTFNFTVGGGTVAAGPPVLNLPPSALLSGSISFGMFQEGAGLPGTQITALSFLTGAGGGTGGFANVSYNLPLQTALMGRYSWGFH
jgi:hypothetical protein